MNDDQAPVGLYEPPAGKFDMPACTEKYWYGCVAPCPPILVRFGPLVIFCWYRVLPDWKTLPRSTVL